MNKTIFGIAISLVSVIAIVIISIWQIYHVDNANADIVVYEQYTKENFAQWASENYDQSYDTILEIFNIEKQTLCNEINTKEKESILDYWRQSYYYNYSIDPGPQKC